MPTTVSTNAVVTLVSEMCLAKTMWTELSSSENTTRSFYVRGASSTVRKVEVICPQIIWSQGSGSASLFPASVSVLVLEEKPGVRSWCPFWLKPQFLILKCRFLWIVTIYSYHEKEMNSIILNPREQLWTLPVQWESFDLKSCVLTLGIFRCLLRKVCKCVLRVW